MGEVEDRKKRREKKTKSYLRLYTKHWARCLGLVQMSMEKESRRKGRLQSRKEYRREGMEATEVPGITTQTVVSSFLLCHRLGVLKFLTQYFLRNSYPNALKQAT